MSLQVIYKQKLKMTIMSFKGSAEMDKEKDTHTPHP